MPATLASLRIRHLALVDQLTWEPGRGMIAVTGETGAGKSMLLGALQLLLGDRADKSLIRSGSDACTVEAVFDVPEPAALDALLEEGGAEPCADGQLLLKRTLSASGPGRQFVNGSPVPLALLRQIGDRLVDLHGPHDHQSLFSREEQTRLLDAFAGLRDLRADYERAFREEARLRGELEGLRLNEEEAARQRDMLAFQVGEIDAARLSADEEDDVLQRLRVASNSQRLIEIAGRLQALLDGDGESLADRLAEGTRLGRELARLDPATDPLRETIEGLAGAATEAAGACRHYASRLETDPAALRQLEERADLLQALKRKYAGAGGTLADVLARRDEAARRLSDIEHRGERLDELTRRLDDAAKRAQSLAARLSRARARHAPALADRAAAALRELGFLKSEFTVRLETLDAPRLCGAELAEFLFAPNPGEPAQPLRTIASSGEVSRVMLALKSAMAEQDAIPLLVFDEIDANVGGEIAVQVGRKMRDLAATHQVLCITHLPQVAAAAHVHFAVRKEFDGTRTTTGITALDAEARLTELARMLGESGGASALGHARALLDQHARS